MNHTATLSVSNKKCDCDRIVQSLLKSGIPCSVTPNDTVICKAVNGKKKCWREKGCRVVFGDIWLKDDMREIWKTLKEENAFECAYVRVPGVFDGCVRDFVAETKCGT